MDQSLSVHSDNSNESTITVVEGSAPRDFGQEHNTPILGSTAESLDIPAGLWARKASDGSISAPTDASGEHSASWADETWLLKQKPEQAISRTLPTQKYRHKTWPLKPHSRSSMHATPETFDDEELMRDKDSSAPLDATLTRSSANRILQECNWPRILILMVAFYSTVMSGLWSAIAIRKPGWGKYISSTGLVAPANAPTVFALFAKSIELSFVTTFLAYLGQELSRRACFAMSKGVSIAEMSMRTWVLQPGSMLAHWGSVRCVLSSKLGFVAFFAAWSAMLYTSASDALVSPKNRADRWDNVVLHGTVSSSFANFSYMSSHCPTVVTDPYNSCMDIQQAGQANHNFIQFMSNWTNTTVQEAQSPDIQQRPSVPAILYDNTTVRGSWIAGQDMEAVSRKYGRIINNVTLAFPHSGILAASQDPKNKILQPSDLGGMGEFVLHAAVLSPAINVLCASMLPKELEPLVYGLWPGRNGSQINSSNWPNLTDAALYARWSNSTPVDDIFGFGEFYNRTGPIFPKLPASNNTVTNHSGPFTDSVYILATAPPSAAALNSSYMMCSLRASLVTNCSTHYRASITGGELSSICEDAAERQLYKPNMPSFVPSRDWASVAASWVLALGLNEGINNGSASLGRLLTQLIPKSASLDPVMPSIAEALAALAGSTLLLSAVDSQLVYDGSQITPHPTTPVYQSFHAALQTHEYRSSYEQGWQLGFYVILLATFAVNCYCLFYLATKGKFVTDVTEPQNLFSLAINSPPSRSLDGAFERGPSKEQYHNKWSIKTAEDKHVYFECDESSGPKKDPDNSSFDEEKSVRRRQESTAYTSVAQQSPEFD